MYAHQTGNKCGLQVGAGPGVSCAGQLNLVNKWTVCNMESLYRDLE